MANLIPPEARQRIKRDYIFRLATVWSMMLGVVLVIIAVLLVPSYFLVSLQLSAYTNDNQAKIDDLNNFKEIETTVRTTNAISSLLNEPIQPIANTELLQTLWSVAENITLVSVKLQWNGMTVSDIALEGIASDRSSLLAFRDALEAEAYFTKAELPISNLAQDENIYFSITLTVADLAALNSVDS